MTKFMYESFVNVLVFVNIVTEMSEQHLLQKLSN